MSNDKEDNRQSKGVPKPEKKPYTKPELVVHGAVDRITENSQGSGSTNDFSGQIAQRSK
jgi:hypothetical protein